MIKAFVFGAVLLALALFSSGVAAQDGCRNFPTVSACAAAASQPTPLLCVWSDEAGCEADKCSDFGDNMTCVANKGCIWMGWIASQNAIKCFSSSLLCSNLPVTACPKYSFCTVRDQTYCGVVGVLGNNKVKAECDISFPNWSIALIFVWLFIMVILGIIVLLALGGGKKAKVAGIDETEGGDVQIDGVGGHRADNFGGGDNFEGGYPLDSNLNE